MRLTQIIEALLFASDAPLTAADLARIDERLDEDTVTAVIEELRSEYDLTERSFQIYDVAGGYQLLTRPEFVTVLERYETVPQSSRLSTPALEVLAIIAYRQPLGRSEIEEIRGVQSAAVLRTLQDRGLVEPVARAEALGRPLLYGTTSKFLEHFAFRSLEDLPRPDELPVVLRARPLGETQTGTAGEAPAGGGSGTAGEGSGTAGEATAGEGSGTAGEATAGEGSGTAGEATAGEGSGSAGELTAGDGRDTAGDASAGGGGGAGEGAEGDDGDEGGDGADGDADGAEAEAVSLRDG